MAEYIMLILQGSTICREMYRYDQLFICGDSEYQQINEITLVPQGVQS